MIRALALSLSFLAVAGCCHEYEAQRPLPPPPIENEARKIDAVEAQLRRTETTGWNSTEERAFSGYLITLPLKTRLEYSQRLARAMTFGKIKRQPPAPPPENAPACPCGANSCGAPAVTGQPGPADRVIK